MDGENKNASENMSQEKNRNITERRGRQFKWKIIRHSG